MKYLIPLFLSVFFINANAFANTHASISMHDLVLTKTLNINTSSPSASLMPFVDYQMLKEETCKVTMKGSINGVAFDFWVEVNMSCKEFWGQFLDEMFKQF